MGQGKAFSFDQAETRIGRTSENDVVLFDPGVSRRHARIVEKDGAYLAEDMGSANGTRVNGQVIQKTTLLKSGDQVGVGPVVFAFQLETPATQVEGQSTRIVNRATVMPSDRSVTEDEILAQPERATAAMAALPRPAPAPAEPGPPAPRPRPGSGAARIAPAASPRPAPQLSAAERARLKRSTGDSLGGQIQYAWSQMTPRARAISGGLTAVVAALGLGVLAWLLWPEQRASRPTGPEPVVLGVKPIEASFGLGPDVNWRRPDMKVFDFEFNTPTRAVVVLHFQAQDISENEVAIIVNGVDQGMVPPDVAGMVERELEQVLAPGALKRNQRNQLIFDNVRNPPGDDPWRVQGLWIEVVPIPELASEDVLRTAHQYAKGAREFQDQREVGSENLFRAWKSYRYAWLSLESLDERPDLYETARFQMAALKRELDQLCSKMMLDAQRSIQLKKRVKARQTLEEVPRYFPTNEHRCHNLALQKLSDYHL